MLKSQELLAKWNKLKTLVTQQQQEIKQIKAQLAKEKEWWNKWMNDQSNYLKVPKTDTNSLPVAIWQALSPYQATYYTFRIKQHSSALVDYVSLEYINELNSVSYGHDARKNLKIGKLMIKAIADYYKSQN